ncbi:cobalamin B12-binding domain-containing protein, partial [Candidatus Parcubacteria bacterium]|nr:cobalamin B12-binding domain-containing protein [Candidatus Parcubacteria bacterium]
MTQRLWGEDAMRILLSAAYSIIEPLGLIYLAGLAKELGHQTRIVLVRDFDFRPLFERVEEFRPDLVGFNVYTGTHKPVYEAMRRLNAMGITTVMGGPHATYFAEDAAQYARHVVRGEGFTGFRHILEGTAPAGVFFDEKLLREGFPCPDRATFYDEHPLHRDNPIKNDITAVGCPWGCTYCFNVQFLKIYGAFRLVARPVEAVIAALEEIRQRWPTRLIFFQDDVFGFNIPWLEEFVRQYRDRVRIPWHAQIRLELTRDPRRLKLFKEGGCCGITTAIESADPWVRKHILDRDGMTNEEIVEGCARIKAAGLRLRTEQITALPTSDLGLDLSTLRLNVQIRPDMAWNSIFAPYRGTDLGELAVRWGYYGGNNDDLSETFFDRSVLTFHWGDRYQTDPTKPNPARRPFSHEENERYRD